MPYVTSVKNDKGRNVSDYHPQNFRDLYETPAGHALWEFLNQQDNVIRMETAVFLERAAIEPLGPALVKTFGEEVSDGRFKQMIGHMVRQILEAHGYTVDRGGLRITRPNNLFTSGTRYRTDTGDAAPAAMTITREQRQAWLEKTADSPFNRWLNKRVRNEDGTLNLDKLYQTARIYDVTQEYRHLNPGQQRMIVGVMLRRKDWDK
jgi:hypothetical protein